MSFALLFIILTSLPLAHASGQGSLSPSSRFPNDISSRLPDVQPHSIYHPLNLQTLGAPPYTPIEIQKAYNFAPLYSRGINGLGTRIAIVDAFGSPSLPTDLSTFDSLTSLPSATLNFYYPDGVPKQKNTGWAVETSLDVEWVHAIAPAATIDLVVAADASLNRIFDAIAFVANNLPNDNALSMSFGLSESSYPATGSFTISAFHQLFITLTSHGTTPLASSGDSGASTCCNIQYPSSDPLVVAVGGTSLILNPDASYAQETTWSGSGAGSSLIFNKPTWQQGLGDSMRDTVDVSYDADPNTGVLIVFGNRLFQVGGTSAGAPQWAALVALAGQASSTKYGAADPLLYKISTFHDVRTGSDGFFSATAGWDYPTGLGSPNANSTVAALGVPPTTVSVSTTMTLDASRVTTTGSLAINTQSATISGSLLVTAVDTVSGATTFTKTYTISSLQMQSTSGTLVARFLLNVAVLPYALSSDITVQLQGATASVSTTLTRQLDINGNGSVDVLDATVVANAFGSSIGSAKYTPLADFNGDGFINILDATVFASYFGALDLR